MKLIYLSTKRLTHLMLMLIGMTTCTIGFGQATQYNFSGNVIDNASNNPIPGASVFIENTTYGGETNFDGDYEFRAALESGAYTLVIRYIGYSTKRMILTLGSETDIVTNISLAEDLLSLDEVVVTGTSVGVNKRTLGNAISTVSASDIQNNGATAVDQALTGKIAIGTTKFR